MFKKVRNQKGFTLIELIVVIAILAILAAIAIPRLGGFTDQANKQADIQTAATIGKAMEMYFASNNGKAAHTSGGCAAGESLSGQSSDDLKGVLVAAGLVDTNVSSTTPKYTPATNTSFVLEITATGSATVRYNTAATGTLVYPQN